MNLASQTAKHFREIHFGGNWTSVNLKETLSTVDYKQATTHVYSLNTIAALVFHINYYTAALLKVLQGEPLDAHDKYSYDLSPLLSENDWQSLLAKTCRMLKILPVLLNKCRKQSFGKIYPVINMAIITGTCTASLSIAIII